MSESVCIIGGGTMGTVLALLLASKGVPVSLWHARRGLCESLVQDRENRRYLPGHRIPEGVRICLGLTEALDQASVLVNAVPTQFVRAVWSEITAHPRAADWLPRVAVVSVTKGLETQRLLRPSEIITEVISPLVPHWAHQPAVAVLSGPSIGPELARCLPAALVAACGLPHLADRVQNLFTTEYLRIYTNPDVIGVEIAGAAKNVVAIAAGILDGLRSGDNAKAALLTRGLVEIARLGVALGACPETFTGLAGLGDLITTAISPLGRNRRVGEHVGRGRPLAEIIAASEHVAEGIDSTRALVALARRHHVDMPIAEMVHAILFEDKDPITAIGQLMSRAPRPESDQAALR